jgi:flagellar motility protein MotE (MotC chaperone)
VPSVKATPSVTKPTDPKSPKSPSTPNPTKPAPITAQPIKPAKPSPKTKQVPAVTEEPAEEAVAELIAKDKAHRKGPHSASPLPDRGEVPERKNPWSADRYAAVVPPGLTLSALRSQISKSSAATAEPPSSAPDNSKPGSAASDIEKAREALRQETAHLEALLKTPVNCGGGMGSTPLGEPMPSTQSISAAALREAASEQIDSVSKAMKGMRPEQAAAMVARLDRGLAAEIMRRMKAIDAGAILGLLKPEQAADLATEIAIRKPMYAKDKKGVAK